MPDFLKDAQITVTNGNSFRIAECDPAYTAGFHDLKEAKEDLAEDRKKIAKLQEKLFANGKHAVLIIFQALDAAGKDSTIEHVMSGLNPQGCSVTNFKQPSKLELAHDFLWRTTIALPARGTIGIFNRSYYEEVLVCKVHPEYVVGQNLPSVASTKDISKDFWAERYRSIRDLETHLAQNGTVILKFFLNVSKNEQRKRFISRLTDPDKHWKFNSNDLKERELWNEYLHAYEEAIRYTATTHAPWFVIPADNKWFMHMAVGDIIHGALKALNLDYPALDDKARKELDVLLKILVKEDD